jgi:hypothetical protein
MMMANEARQLKPGDRVLFGANTPEACTGTVLAPLFSAVRFEWDDGEVSSFCLGDMASIQRHRAPTTVLPEVPLSAPPVGLADPGKVRLGDGMISAKFPPRNAS